MNNNFSIAQYTPDRREVCVDLFQKVYGSPPFNFDWLDRSKAYMYFSDLENIPNALNYVLTDENGIFGVCMGQKEDNFQNPGYKINEFFIEPDHQHMGIGTHFINELEKILHESGIKTMYLFTQRSMDSFSFYQNNGFIPNDETVHMVKIIRQEPTVLYTRTYMNSEN